MLNQNYSLSLLCIQNLTISPAMIKVTSLDQFSGFHEIWIQRRPTWYKDGARTVPPPKKTPCPPKPKHCRAQAFFRGGLILMEIKPTKVWGV